MSRINIFTLNAIAAVKWAGLGGYKINILSSYFLKSVVDIYTDLNK